MNGYLVSTDPSASNDESGNAGNNVDALVEMMADVDIANHGSVEDITQDEHIYKAFIFEILSPSKPGSQPESLVTSPGVSTSNKQCTHLVNIVQRRITDLFSRREGSPSILLNQVFFICEYGRRIY